MYYNKITVDSIRSGFRLHTIALLHHRGVLEAPSSEHGPAVSDVEFNDFAQDDTTYNPPQHVDVIDNVVEGVGGESAGRANGSDDVKEE